MSQEETEERQNHSNAAALKAWREFLELGKLLTESNPSAPSLVKILEEMREEESQWPLPQDLADC